MILPCTACHRAVKSSDDLVAGLSPSEAHHFCFLWVVRRWTSTRRRCYLVLPGEARCLAIASIVFSTDNLGYGRHSPPSADSATNFIVTAGNKTSLTDREFVNDGVARSNVQYTIVSMQIKFSTIAYNLPLGGSPFVFRRQISDPNCQNWANFQRESMI